MIRVDVEYSSNGIVFQLYLHPLSCFSKIFGMFSSKIMLVSHSICKYTNEK
jgi:hypothetical protein